MKKSILAACILLLAANFSFAQDSTATINSTWPVYATDTSLTFRQIVITCDSLFALAGYPDTTGDGADTSFAENDGKPYYEYLTWRNFWGTRCDVATGKLHNFAADVVAMLTSGSSPSNCAGTSYLQSHTPTLTNVLPGWAFIGPQNITVNPPTIPFSLTGEGGYVNTLHQHLGRVDGIIVNSANPNEVYAADSWGGLWKTSNANLAPIIPGPASATTCPLWLA